MLQGGHVLKLGDFTIYKFDYSAILPNDNLLRNIEHTCNPTLCPECRGSNYPPGLNLSRNPKPSPTGTIRLGAVGVETKENIYNGLRELTESAGC